MDEILSPNDLNNEEKRLNTFNHNWPHAYISPRILAKTGFYYMGPHDQVKCHFCKINISSWEIGDNEIMEHERWSMNCPLIKRRDTSNIPTEPKTELNELLSGVSRGFCKIDRAKALLETPFNKGIIDSREIPQIPDFPEFMGELDRLDSFDGWPESNEQSPKQLSEAGFFYTQKNDRVICFSCGGGLCEWAKEDVPWEQHAWWYSACDYLRSIKGLDYINMVFQKFATSENENLAFDMI